MITCVGIGPGDLELVTAKARRLIHEADVIAGFDSVVEVIRADVPPGAQVVTMGYRDQEERLAEVAARHHDGARIVVVLMGDAHFSGFQYVERVERACGHEVQVVPGISAAQVLASKARVCFDETTFVTLHRRGDVRPFLGHAVDALLGGRNVILIPHPWDWMPAEVAGHLQASGVAGDTPVEVWEDLTAGAERCWKGPLADCTAQFSDMSIMLVHGSPLDGGRGDV